MSNNRSDSSRDRFGVIGVDRRVPRVGVECDVGVEQRGLNPAVSKITVRPEPPKPIVTNQTTPKQPSRD